MARRSKVVTIDAGTRETNRDFGKRFQINEMSADAAERWAIRCLLAFANAGAKIPEEKLMQGLEGMQATANALLIQGVRSLAGLAYRDAEPLLAEMLACVEFKPGSDSIPNLSGATMLTQIEEVKTLLTLRYEVLQLHLGFSPGEALSNLTGSPTPAPASP